MKRLYPILFVIVVVCSCETPTTKAKYSEECDLLMAFYNDLSRKDHEYIIKKYFVQEYNELDEAVKQAYVGKMNYLAEQDLSNDECKVEDYEQYKIVNMGNLRLKIKKVDDVGFLIESCVPLMKGDTIIGWI